MKKKKKIDAKLKLEKRLYKTFVFITIFLILGIIYSKATLAKINLEIQDLSGTIKEETEDNQSLAMRINEMVSLEKIQQVSDELGLTYNNKNIKTVLE